MSLKIRKRSKNCYELRYTINGSQKSIYGKSRFECRDKLKALKTENRKPRLIKTTTFENWFNKWIDLYRKPNLKNSTLTNLVLSFKKNVLPYIANKSIRLISPIDIQKIINKMQTHPRQATIIYTQLNLCFKQAFLVNLIDYNPCTAVVIKRSNGNKGKALTKAQELKFVDYLNKNNHPLKNMFFIYLSTGMRRSELLNISKNDLDFTNNEIHIAGTKTKNSDRIIQVSEKVLNLFPKNEELFKNISPSYIDKEFKKICKKLALKDIKLHSLRHTFATRCIENGIDMVVVQSWLGHASISLTIDTYTHIENDYKKEELKKISFSFLP